MVFPLNSKPILGIALDGWVMVKMVTLGWRIFISRLSQFKRLATFKPVAMIGWGTSNLSALA
jgi:hydrogenase maturation factor HypF (carbamoyltransferase family)